jgi:hypothetical protein
VRHTVRHTVSYTVRHTMWHLVDRGGFGFRGSFFFTDRFTRLELSSFAWIQGAYSYVSDLLFLVCLNHFDGVIHT